MTTEHCIGPTNFSIHFLGYTPKVQEISGETDEFPCCNKLVLTTECSTGGVLSNMRIGHPLKMKVYSWEIHLPSGNLLQFAIENTP